MSLISLSVRPATAADFRAWCGREPDAAWHCQWQGVLVERDGIPVAIGVMSLDPWNRVWLWTDMREPLPPVMLHRTVLDCLDEMLRRGITIVHCYRNEEISGSERWLRRLGFVPAPEVGGPFDKMVWKCTLIST